MTGTITHHTESWPIVVSTIYGKDHSDEALRVAYAGWTAFMHRGPHVLIMDMSHGNAGSTAAQRAKVAEWLEQNDALLRAHRQLAHVIVVDSPVVRGIITAVFWLRPPANPHYTARTLDEAIDIAVQCLREARIAVTPEQVAAARRVRGSDPPRALVRGA